jgi:adenosylcobyric acid synthase
LSGLSLRGYEIRCGHTEGPAPVARADDGQAIAWQQGPVLGVYAHGLFEQPAFLQALFGQAAPTLDDALDRLAQNLEAACGAATLRGLLALDG